MNTELDFLGNEITVGTRAIRAHSYAHNKEFKKVTVIGIDPDKKYGDCIEIVTDGNTKSGWTYPHRLIVQEAFKKII